MNTAAQPFLPEPGLRLLRSATRLSTLRRARIRRAALGALIVLAGSATAACRLMRVPPPRAVTLSTDPYVPKVGLTFAVDEERTGLSGLPARAVGVVVENRGEASLECLRLALRVLDAEGREQRNNRRDLRCAALGDPLWPQERAVIGFETLALEPSEHLDVVVEELTLGPPPAGAPALKPMTVKAAPSVGIADLSPFLTHQLRLERLDEDPKYKHGELLVVFTVTALPPHQVTDLDYELRLSGLDGYGFESVAGRWPGAPETPRARAGSAGGRLHSQVPRAGPPRRTVGAAGDPLRHPLFASPQPADAQRCRHLPPSLARPVA